MLLVVRPRAPSRFWHSSSSKITKHMLNENQRIPGSRRRKEPGTSELVCGFTAKGNEGLASKLQAVTPFISHTGKHDAGHRAHRVDPKARSKPSDGIHPSDGPGRIDVSTGPLSVSTRPGSHSGSPSCGSPQTGQTGGRNVGAVPKALLFFVLPPWSGRVQEGPFCRPNAETSVKRESAVESASRSLRRLRDEVSNYVSPAQSQRELGQCISIGRSPTKVSFGRFSFFW